MAQVKEYKLIDKTIFGDINYENIIVQLDSSSPGIHLLDSVFKPTKGKYAVYRFLAKYKGLSILTDKRETFHDVLILKTDDKNRVIEGLQYTLEWIEAPLEYDLYKCLCKSIYLKDRMLISKFNFVSMNNNRLKQNAIVKLK